MQWLSDLSIAFRGSENPRKHPLKLDRVQEVSSRWGGRNPTASDATSSHHISLLSSSLILLLLYILNVIPPRLPFAPFLDRPASSHPLRFRFHPFVRPASQLSVSLAHSLHHPKTRPFPSSSSPSPPTDYSIYSRLIAAFAVFRIAYIHACPLRSRPSRILCSPNILYADGSRPPRPTLD